MRKNSKAGSPRPRNAMIDSTRGSASAMPVRTLKLDLHKQAVRDASKQAR